MKGRDIFVKVRGIICFLTKMYALFPRSVRMKLLVHHRTTKGNKGIVIRYALLKSLASEIGDNVAIMPDVYLLHPECLTIGNHVSIHPFCYLECIGGVSIGNDVSIAEGTSIISFEHKYTDLTVPIKNQGIWKKAISIDDDVWIGAKSTILSGMRIEKGAIVAAGAVVTKNVEAFSIVAGVPAKKIKNRKLVEQ